VTAGAVLPAGATALPDRLAALEAERLAPVPRASHAVGVDLDDLALVLRYVRATLRAARLGGPLARPAAPLMSREAIDACQRLEASIAGRAPGLAR
jgi:hypothetical protein